jgi:hypothetical protein
MVKEYPSRNPEGILRRSADMEQHCTVIRGVKRCGVSRSAPVRSGQYLAVTLLLAKLTHLHCSKPTSRPPRIHVATRVLCTSCGVQYDSFDQVVVLKSRDYHEARRVAKEIGGIGAKTLHHGISKGDTSFVAFVRRDVCEDCRQKPTSTQAHVQPPASDLPRGPCITIDNDFPSARMVSRSNGTQQVGQRIPAGTRLEVLDRDRVRQNPKMYVTWCKVMYKGVAGWVSEFVTTER